MLRNRFSGLDIDTGGIAAIMEILKHLRHRQGLVVIAGATPQVGEIFEIAGFARLRPWPVTAPTVEEGIRMAQERRRTAPSASQPASGS
jgi:anti-anti-sigma regulatory factor